MPIIRSDCVSRDQHDVLAPLRAQQVIAHVWGVGLIRSWNDVGWYRVGAPQFFYRSLHRPGSKR